MFVLTMDFEELVKLTTIKLTIRIGSLVGIILIILWLFSK